MPKATLEDGDTITIPETGAELEAMLGDSGQMKKLFTNKEKFNEFISNYVRHVHNQDVSIATQVRDETQRQITNWLKENGSDLERPNLDITAPVWSTLATKPGDNPYVYNKGAMGAKLDKEFENAAHFFKTIWHNSNLDASGQAKIARVRNAFSSNVPSEGGFLIPEVLRAELLRVALESSVVRSRARIIPMETLRVPFPAIDSTSNVSSVFGGITAFWTEEGAALQESQASFKRIVLDAKKLTIYTEVPNELISDSIISFQAFLDQIFPEAMGFFEDVAFFTGTGVGEPLGFLNAPAAVEVPKETGQAANTVLWENVVKMYSRMLPQSLNRAVWVASIDTFPQLATMALNVGTGGSAVWLSNGVQGPPITILGRPVIFSEKARTLGSAGDLNFVDFGFYLVGDRQVMSATSSQHFKFQNDLTAFRIIERVDGLPWLQSAITPQNNGDSLSPFVKIAVRA